MVRPLACCALISSDHSCKRTACLIVAISVVLFCIMLPPMSNGLQFTTWSFWELLGISNLLRQASWSLLYIIGQREGRRGILYSYEDTEILRVTQQLHTNVVAYLTPYINEFTIDIIPQASFSPTLGEYLKDVPILLKNSDAFKETLCHRCKTLSANGLKIHFENSSFTKDVLLKEIYHKGAIVCLYRIETTQGETAGFYNTQTKQFVSMFTHTEEQTTLLGNYIESTILWCYAAFVGSDTSILPTSESYNEYLSDPTVEVTFTSIGGKLRVPTGTKHIRTIAGDDRYETEIKHISGYIRKLPDGQKASERAITLAQSLGYDLAENETYVQPFERSSWIINKRR